MNTTAAALNAVVIEREMPHPPEKIWRALTDSGLMAQWLMANDFKAAVGHRFNFRMAPMANWNGITDCEVLLIEPPRKLAYSWGASGQEAANGLKTTVTWLLTPTQSGTLVRMEQAGFQPQDAANQQGAKYGWQKFIGGLERVVGELQ
jgi:uncharacterized protein YndB with AHSA1/START domain